MTFQWQPFSEKALRSLGECDARMNIWHGAVRSSKTITSLVAWIAFVRDAPPGDLMMIGATERSLVSNILNPLEQIVGGRFWTFRRGVGEALLFGRRILIRSANNRAAIRAIQGSTLAGAYGDELTLWPDNVFRQLMLRLSVEGARFFGTTNPDGPYHWLKMDYLDRANELGIRAWHFELRDNKALPQSYVDAIEREYVGLWYRRFVKGEWVIAEGAVYDMFDPEQHVVDILPNRTQPAYVGIDYGTSNPTVFELGGMERETLYIMREWDYDARAEGRQMTDIEFSQAFREWIDWPLQLRSIDVDPSAASFKAQLLQDGVRPVRNANNDVLDGIRVVSRALTAGNLKIHRSCTRLINEMTSYTWDPDAQQRGEDVPMKQNDHAADACRYLAMRALGRRGLPSLPKPKAA